MLSKGGNYFLGISLTTKKCEFLNPFIIQACLYFHNIPAYSLSSQTINPKVQKFRQFKKPNQIIH